jgi:two-component system NtrC family sensor kinase
MKVAAKIILVASLAFLPILGVHTALSLRREEKLFRSDMERDLSLLGSHLREISILEWSRSGNQGVKLFLGSEVEANPGVAVAWREATRTTRGLGESEDALVWVEPVVIDGTAVGEIVLTETLAPMRAYLHSTLLWLGVLTFLLISGGLVAVSFLSHRLIGRRLNRLVAFAAETGAGRLGRSVDVGGRDEITHLGSSLSAMSKALAAAHNDAERLNDERLMMLQHLRHADRLASLGRLAGSVAHELGTPLNVVMGHANRISEGTTTPSETKESAATIHRQVKRMETTIRDILGFAKQAPGREERIDLNAVAQDVCRLLQPLAQRQGVRLEVDAPPASARVRGRVVQIEQVLSNLVSNAVDASPEGGEVSLEIAREERVPKTGGKARRVVVVRVRDRGPGIAEADIGHVFEAFYTSKAAGQGTGLGLWLAEGIVCDHGGIIEVENCSEGGACFTVVLPEEEVQRPHGPRSHCR